MMTADKIQPWPDGLPVSTDDIFAMLAEHSKNAAIVTDPGYRILWVNHSFTLVTGYSLEEVSGRSPAEFMRCPETDPSVEKKIQDSIAQGVSFRATLLNRRKDGTHYWVRIEGQPSRNPKGELMAFVVVGTDVTGMVEREATLKRNETLLNETQRIARIGSWEYDPATQIGHWSPETFRIYGLPVSDPAPSMADRIAVYIEAHRPIVETAFTQCLMMGVPYDVEVQLRRSDGRELWVRSIGYAETEHGRIIRVAGAVQDIDERKRAELEIARLADRIALATRSAGIGIWEYEVNTGRLIWDDVMLRLYGIARHEFTGALVDWENRVHPEDLAGAKDRFDQAFSDIGESDIEFRICLPEGAVRHVKGNIRIVRSPENSILRAYGVNYDVTRERASEQALRASEQNLLHLNSDLQTAFVEAKRLAREAEAANQSKSSFLATMSHEIRTPLNGVIGMTHILAGTKLDDEQREYLRTIKLSGETLLSLINDTLDYSKIEAGRFKIDHKPFDVVLCVEEAIDLVSARALAKGLELIGFVHPNVPRMIIGDGTRLRQILVNLLSNAIKFTERGEVSIEMTLVSRRQEPSECTLRFSVTDSGIGIPVDKQDRLFERFYQVDTSTTRAYGGTGLGLAISKRLAELMNGTIDVDSAAGKGSTFRLTLQAEQSRDHTQADRATCFARLCGRRVLILDDNAVNRRVLELQIRHAGMTCVTEPDGASALARLENGERFDLIISDVQMPGMDGFTFVQELLSRGLKHCPVMMLSSIGELASLAGADASVNKPVKSSQFYPMLAALFGPAPAPAAAPTAPVILPGTLMPLNLLMAEDNIVNQRVAQLTLKRLGYEAQIVSDGSEAVATLQNGSFDVILMDVQMPKMDGLEATRRIRTLPAHQDRPWIIALTAGAFEEDRQKAIASGMNDFLSKPLRVELLHAALSRAWEVLQSRTPRN
ncbi:MAG: response regulator [Opitutaceae bacterium]|jgi:PAS domain S-box-containing protein